MSVELGATLPPVIIAPPATGHVTLYQPPPATAMVLPGGATSGNLQAVQDRIDATVAVHRNDPTPHPAYDDYPSMRLIFQNGLV